MAELRLGAWARAGQVTGLVVALDDASATVFEPGERRLATLARAQVQPVPAGAVRVTLSMEVPLPHGVGDATLRRWMAALTDPVLRERAATALEEAGMDTGPALPSVDDVLTPAAGDDAVCLCGARTPTAGRDEVACAACGRSAVVPPRSG